MPIKCLFSIHLADNLPIIRKNSSIICLNRWRLILKSLQPPTKDFGGLFAFRSWISEYRYPLGISSPALRFIIIRWGKPTFAGGCLKFAVARKLYIYPFFFIFGVGFEVVWKFPIPQFCSRFFLIILFLKFWRSMEILVKKRFSDWDFGVFSQKEFPDNLALSI